MEGGEPVVITNPEGGRLDAIRGRLQQNRRAVGRSGGETAGGHQPGEHGVLDQALHGAPLRGSERGDEDGPLPRRAGWRPRGGAGALRRQGRTPASVADFRHGARETEEGRRGVPRPGGHEGGHHGAGVLQRRAAPGDQGGGHDCRTRGHAHRQRADRGGAGLRPRQEEGRDDCRLRLRRRHLRHLDPRGGRGRGRGEVDQRRHAPRRRQPRPAHHRLDHRRVPEERRHRPRQGPDGAAAAAGGRGEGQDGTLQRDGERNQPAVHQRGRERAQAPANEAHAREVRAAGGRPAAEDRRSGEAGARGRGPAALAE